MKPLLILTERERESIFDALATISSNPYLEYQDFAASVTDLIASRRVPRPFLVALERVRSDRRDGASVVHVLRNCPIDRDLPDLGNDDPMARKHELKKTFIGEALLELCAQLTGTPLLAYARNRGDFFTDVVAIDRFSGTLTGYSDSELYYHNDRTAHEVRADYIALLGLRCPGKDLIYTGFIDGRDLLEECAASTLSVLREPYFITPFDVYSRDKNNSLTVSKRHPILENDHSFRYLDTSTTVAPGSPERAKDALLDMKNALTRVTRTRHRILEGDLLLLANQDGLHSREKVEVVDPTQVRSRWLLKTYAFRDEAARASHREKWLDGVPGRVAD
ncbi:TauD/TfdA family dioxygenase [Frankia sp. AiPs1]|uniref:TauD/TfdA family dioxygenase n=1 Tax=Frankia sp. AiPs1 TaxID=573493 RepID=UPI0020438012|nr:TauD/TfdA family dioxygenase [Frankia sp. AiPs1]MCM3920534.1 TauD/TfdA family dioxygenase [Frankia sp. AiPs1]